MKREAQEGLYHPSLLTPPSSPRFWAVVPAAGSGARMAAAVPKQYLALRGKTVLQHTLDRILSHPRLAAVVLAIAADDRLWPRLAAEYAGRTLLVTQGGAERSTSVRNGLQALADRAAPGDWVLVHDAARPCVRRADIDALLAQLQDHPVGGLLGVPVADTMKRVDGEGNIIATVERSNLWRALTPQMFRYQPLRAALQAAQDQRRTVTDEAAAMELAGCQPRMVQGHPDNIKITHPQDLALAEWYLGQQEEES